LSQLLALRDVSLYVISASIQYAANRETQDMRLQSNSAKSRNAVLTGLDHLRLPPHMPRVDVIATFSSYFRIILPDTLNLQRQNTVGSRVDDCELDALDALCTRLMERQVIHRVSDRDMTHGINQIIRNILVHDRVVDMLRRGLHSMFLTAQSPIWPVPLSCGPVVSSCRYATPFPEHPLLLDADDDVTAGPWNSHGDPPPSEPRMSPMWRDSHYCSRSARHKADLGDC
jgi:hypothetical protein